VQHTRLNEIIDCPNIRFEIFLSFEKFNTKSKKEDQLSREIIGASIEVHRTLGGPGLLESIYEAALCHEITLKGLNIQRQRPIQIIYKGVTIKDPLLVDIIVEDKVLIEVKATEKHHPIYETQVLTYLRLTGIKLSLLINFGAPFVKDGISRIINGVL
jgi:GxxExxY protein